MLEMLSLSLSSLMKLLLVYVYTARWIKQRAKCWVRGEGAASGLLFLSSFPHVVHLCVSFRVTSSNFFLSLSIIRCSIHLSLSFTVSPYLSDCLSLSFSQPTDEILRFFSLYQHINLIHSFLQPLLSSLSLCVCTLNCNFPFLCTHKHTFLSLYVHLANLETRFPTLLI